jgi:hypothetical protein
MLAVRGWSANGRKQQPRGCEPARDRDPSRPSANILASPAIGEGSSRRRRPSNMLNLLRRYFL